MTKRLTLNTISAISDALNLALNESGLLLTEEECSPALFDLRTGIAGELFQKLTNYQLPLAIVISDSKAYGARLSELIYEHRDHGLIRFFADEKTAAEWLDAKIASRA